MDLEQKQKREVNQTAFLISMIILGMMVLMAALAFFDTTSHMGKNVIRVVLILAVIGVNVIGFMKYKNKKQYMHFCLLGLMVAYTVTLFMNRNIYMYAFMFPVAMNVMLYKDLTVAKIGCTIAAGENIIFCIKNCIVYPETSSEGVIQMLFAVLVCATAYVIVKLQERQEIEKMEEIGRRGEAQQTVARAIIELSEALSDKFDGAREVAEKLTESMEISHSSVSDIAKSVKLTAESIEHQTSMTSDIQSSMQSAGEDACQMQETSESSKEVIGEGARLIEELKVQAVKTAKINLDTRETTNELDECIKEVEAIIGTILSISDQTNLLALNASIEAARAGEAGKGFAVVADEIRKLSEETKESTAQITEIIAKLTENVQKASENMQQSAESSEKQNDMIGITGEKFGTVKENIDALYGNTIAIAKEVEDIIKANMAITDSITNLSATSEEVAASSESSLAVSDESMAELHNLNAYLAEVNEISRKMKEMVEQNV